MELVIRALELHECSRIVEIDASQYIGRAWREVDGVKQLVNIHYQSSDFPEGLENHLNRLRKTMVSNGIVLGAFNDKRLVGFCSVNSSFLGVKYRYNLLDQLFIIP